MILKALGERFNAEFSSCGHSRIQDVAGGQYILRQLESGVDGEVRSGLHALAGHAGVEIGETIPGQRRALVRVASEVGKGAHTTESHGRLLAASQFQTAKIGSSIGQPVSADSVLQVYGEALCSPRAKRESDFASWMVGTSLAALRESRTPSAADTLLQQVLADRELANDLNIEGPSRLRQVLILAAPKLCLPRLFPCYELALLHGNAEERGLALINVAQLPAVIRALGSLHQSRIALLQWCSRFGDALEFVLHSPGGEFIAPQSSGELVPRQKVEGVFRDLRRVSRADNPEKLDTPGSSTAIPPVHVCGPSCRHDKPLINL